MSELPPRSSEKPLLGKDFYSRFLEEDQKLMKSGKWDYKDETSRLNTLKTSIESTPDSTLSEEQVNDKNSALWLWYHHASQFAYTKHADTQTALAFIDKALEYREKIQSHNQITPLLRLIYMGDMIGAKAFTDTIPDSEKKTALNLVSYFEQLKKSE